jgi:hypothetical protein
MAIFAQADLTANSNNLVVALAAAATVNIMLSNRTGGAITVSVAIVPSGTGAPGNQHWIEYSLQLDGNEPLERGGIPLSTGDQIFCNPSAPGVSCSVVGILI